MPPLMLSYQGGINPTTSPGTLPQNQLISAENVVLSGGSLVNRGGMFNILQGNLTTITQITGVFYWIDSSGNEWFILGGTSTGNDPELFQMQNDNSTKSLTLITTTSMIGQFPKFASLNGILIITGGGFVPLQWTGSGSASALGTTWTSLGVGMVDACVVNNFLFMAGSGFSSNGSYVFWSNVGDPTTFTGSNFLAFRLADGDFITGLSSIGTDLVIFKNRAIGLLSTQTTVLAGAVILGPLTTISETIGCIGPNAYDHLPDGRIIFIGSDQNVYIFDGSIITNISNQAYPYTNIQTLINSLSASTSFGSTSFVRTYVSRHEVWFSNPILGNDILVYDYVDNAWFQKPNPSGNVNYTIQSMGIASSNRSLRNIATHATGSYSVHRGILTGDFGGNLWLQDSGSIFTDQSGSNPTSQIEFSVPVESDTRPNLNYFFVLPLKTGSASQTITYFVGKNGTYGSSQTFTTTGGWDRLKIPMLISDPMTSQQVKVQYVTGTTIQFDPAYISSEGDQ